MIAEAPFSGLADAVRERAERWRIPEVFTGAVRGIFEWRAGWSWDDVDLRREVGRIRAPVLLLHGDRDDVSECRNSLDLHACCPPGRTELWMVPGAGHVDAFRCAELEYGLRLARFWGTADSIRLWEQWRDVRVLTDAALVGNLTDPQAAEAARWLRVGEMMPTRIEAVSCLSLARRADVRDVVLRALTECANAPGEFAEVRRYAARVLANLGVREPVPALFSVDADHPVGNERSANP